MNFCFGRGKEGNRQWGRYIGKQIHKNRSKCKKAVGIALQFPANSFIVISKGITEKRGNSHGITKVNSNKKKLQIHNDRYCRNAIFACKGKCSTVKYYSGDGNGKLINKFRRAIDCTFQTGFPMQIFSDRMQMLFISQKIKNSQEEGERQTKYGCQSGSQNSHTHAGNKHIIQYNVGYSAGYGQEKAVCR